MKESMKETIARYRNEYDSLRPVFSPAIGEDVHFNAQGFKHLVYKGKHRRTNAVIYSRLVLIPLIPAVIRTARKSQRYVYVGNLLTARKPK